MPTISVIVPVYKVEPYLRQCVDSILAQTYTDFELILVDDGSPDGCGAICDEYAEQDPRVRVIHQENRGLSAARNAGIDAASGEYLAFADSDDLLAPACLKRLHDTVVQENVDIAVCDMRPFSDESELECVDACAATQLKIMTGREACLSIYHMDGEVPIMAWGKLYPARLFDGIRYPVGLIHEDDATTPRLLYRSNAVGLIPDKLYLYRTRPDSITGRPFSVKSFDCVRAVQACVQFFDTENDRELAELARNAQRVAQAKTVIRAYGSRQSDRIPTEYRIHKLAALRHIRRSCVYDTFSWYLSLVCPRLVRPYAYLVKIRKILGFKE